MRRYLSYAKKGWAILWDRLRTQGLRVTLLWMYARGIPSLTGVPILRYCQVTPQLFVGAQYNRRGKRLLESAGIQAGVNLRIEFDDAAHGLSLDQYCYLPTVDDTPPSLENLMTGIRFIQQVIEGGGKVYIHCAGGVGRAPTMAAAYLISTGMERDDAIRLIRRARPFIHIMPGQYEQLGILQTALGEGKLTLPPSG